MLLGVNIFVSLFSHIRSYYLYFLPWLFILSLFPEGPIEAQSKEPTVRAKSREPVLCSNLETGYQRGTLLVKTMNLVYGLGFQISGW